MATQMELLAPAGSPDIAKAAFHAGADACYIGGRWSARAYAQNFTDEQVQEIVHYAHLRGKKIYVALNTMLYERELPEALEYTRLLYKMGVDALIAADLGYIRAVRAILPDFEIHVSTQAGIQNAAGAKAMADLGCTRVVPARECTLEDLRAMADTGVEVEAFCHGAMCSGVSGTCLMSGVIGGRSGNRGRCAQPCRQEYTLFGKKAYHLSTKDLCTLDLLQQFAEAGVCSLKIEGRMKKQEYVVSAVAAYRKVLDAAGFRADTEALQKELACVFNRGGFSHGYLEGSREITYPRRQNHLGLYLGKLTEVKGGRGLVPTIHPLEKGDSIEVGKSGFSLAYADPEAKGWRIPIPKEARAGDPVYLKSSPRILRKAEAAAQDIFSHGVTLDFTAAEGGKAVLQGRMGGLWATAEFTIEQKAQKPNNIENIKEKLSKTGGTVFRIAACNVKLTGQPFLPVSALNGLRRQVLEALQAGLAGAETRPLPAGDYASPTWPAQSSKAYVAVQVSTAVQAQAAVQAGAGRLYLAPADGMELTAMCKVTGAEKFLVLPAFFTETTAKWLREFAQKQHIDGVVAPNPGAIAVAKELGYRVVSDLWCNVANSSTAAQLAAWGAESITFSAEADIGAMAALKGAPLEVIAYGRLPLMNLRHCPTRKSAGCEACGTGVLEDKLGYRFPLRKLWAGECMAQVYNAVPMAADTLAPLRAAGARGLRLIFTEEDEGLTYAVTRAYTAAWPGGDAVRIPEGVSPRRSRGHLYRGVE